MGGDGSTARRWFTSCGVLGVAGILLGLFLLAVASFADGSTAERAVTISIAVGFVAIGGLLLRFSRSH